MSVRSTGLAGSSRRNGEYLPVSSHYLDKPTYPTVLETQRKNLVSAAHRLGRDRCGRGSITLGKQP